ncbi:hypothetical protein D3C87_1698750 [compost metagenome]
MVAAWRVVRSDRSLAPESSSPLAVRSERVVSRNCPTTSAKRAIVPLRATRRSSNSGGKLVWIGPVRSPSASRCSPAPMAATEVLRAVTSVANCTTL